MKNKSVSIFIPAYNEEAHIYDVIYESKNLMELHNIEYEIIVVDDGSSDRTAEILSKLKLDIPELKVITHLKNRGVGQSMIDGMSCANKELIFFNSADKQAPMSHLIKMMPMMEKYDLVVGRFDGRKDHFLRIFSSRVYHLLARLLFGVKLRNINALKLLKREVFDRNHDYSSSLCIDLEIIVWALKRNFKVSEISLEHFQREDGGGSKVISLRNTINTFMNLFFLKRKLWS